MAGQGVNENEALKKLKKSEFIKGKFEQQRYLKDIPRPILSKGNFIVWRNYGFYWETAVPFYHATSFSSDKLYQWVDENTAILLEEGGFRVNSKVSSLILAFFIADFDSLRRDFDISWAGKNNQWIATLVPVNKYIKKALQQITISGDSHIKSVQLRSKAGDLTDIRLFVDAEGVEPEPADKRKILSDEIIECCVKH